MPHWLAQTGDALQTAPLKRFDPRYWTVNFPRPMMASVTTTGPHGLRVETIFYKKNDLCGLIWDAEDGIDHPLLAYETSRDFSGCVLRFHWQSSGLIPLNAVNGPTLTIEGRDAEGDARIWYVRLWNYAQGTAENADIVLDFDDLAGGFLHPSEADPVWPHEIDRLFFSLIPPGYDGSDTVLDAPASAWVELSAIACDGPGSVLEIGDALVPPHGLSIATAYDDCYNQTPARLLHTIQRLGYRGSINHYVGMSHYFRLEPLGSGHYVSLSGGALNAPCAAWHADFAAKAKALDYSLITSLSYELFDAHCWNDWKQRAWNGDAAQTGWSPPSTLLSPAHAGAMAYLQAVARAFVQIAVTAGHAPRFQIGEPWWWIMPDGRPCLYDTAAKAALGGSPVNIPTIRSAGLNAAQKSLLDAAGAVLAASTAALAGAVKADHASCETLLLTFLPTNLDPAAPELRRANLPLGWAAPAFDVLQLEDYDWITSGHEAASAAGIALAEARLGYPPAKRHYLSGFVLNPEDAAQWRLIDAAAERAQAAGTAETFLWALPQIQRDGFVHFSIGDEEMQAFDNELFPLEIGKGASVEPGFSTAIVTSASGHEQRNMDWANARMRYDAGPGLRSEADVRTLLNFFRARRGAAKAFRFRDPLDHAAEAQSLGTGDGTTVRFPLVKRYGSGPDAEVRAISHPLPGSVSVFVNAVAQASGWTLDGDAVSFATPPATGASITASFQFDVPVRFEEDRLRVDLSTWAAGDIPSVPLIEVRP
jgi:uncharacterized protein (TIGR02217 family)